MDKGFTIIDDNKNQFSFVNEDKGFSFVDTQDTTAPVEQEPVVNKTATDALETVKNIGKVYPAVETAANLVTSTYGMPLSGLAGLITLVGTGDLEKANAIQDEVSKALIYQPQTEGGEELTKATFYPIEKLSQFAGYAGGKVEETGHPVAGALVKTAIEASPILFGGVKMMKKGKVGEPEAPVQTVESVETNLKRNQFNKQFIEGEIPDNSTILYGGLPVNEMGNAWIKYIGEPIWDGMINEKLPQLLEKIPGGKQVNRAFIYDYRGDLPNTTKYLASMEAKRIMQSTGREYAVDLGKRLQDFPETSQLKMGEYIRGQEVKLSSAEKTIADEAKSTMLELGQQAVEAGLLDEGIFFKNAGRYMPRLYTKFEYEQKLAQFGFKKPERLDLSRFKKRKDIPKEIRQEMGEILTPGYPVAKGVAQLTHDISTARFFNGISNTPEWSLPKNTSMQIPQGWKQLPETKKLGKLSGSHVHPEIYNDLMETIRIDDTPSVVWKKALGAWKYGKVIISPKTHARNMMSNSILAHLGGLPMYEQPYYLKLAAKEMRTKGKYWQQIVEHGGSHTYVGGELESLFKGVESKMTGIKASGLPEKFGIIGNMWDVTKKGARKASDLYQAEEMWFKTAKFIHNIERKKMNPYEAWADAEKWLFNYEKITKFQEKYRTKWYGAPFGTFTFKAAPRIAEAAIKTPWRFALPGGMIYALEEAARKKIGDTRKQAQAKKELRPDWMQGGILGIPNFARVPIVDASGREYYLNLTYILPWGDIGEAGNLGPIPGGILPMSQPFVREAMQQISNYDNFWRQEIVPEEELAGKTESGRMKTQVQRRLGHAARSILPAPALDVAKVFDSITQRPDYRGRFRDIGVVAADVIAGVKMYPVDYMEQVLFRVSKLDPQKGSIGVKLVRQIKTLSIKKKALEDRGIDASEYEEQIKQKVEQLKGLAKEIKKVGETERKINRR